MSENDFTYEVTGFQSACSEYAEDLLSLDKRYLTNRPATFIIEARGDAKHLGIKNKDKLIIDRSIKPSENQLVLLVKNNEFVVMKFSRKMTEGQDPENGDFVWGVITTLVREFKCVTLDS